LRAKSVGRAGIDFRPGIFCLAGSFFLINNRALLFKSNGSINHPMAGFLPLKGSAADHAGNNLEQLQMKPELFSIPGLSKRGNAAQFYLFFKGASYK
jgi:hypothetical protein